MVFLLPPRLLREFCPWSVFCYAQVRFSDNAETATLQQKGHLQQTAALFATKKSGRERRERIREERERREREEREGRERKGERE